MTTPYRILHVDDDPLMRDLVALSLELDPALLLLNCDGNAQRPRAAPKRGRRHRRVARLHLRGIADALPDWKSWLGEEGR